MLCRGKIHRDPDIAGAGVVSPLDCYSDRCRGLIAGVALDVLTAGEAGYQRISYRHRLFGCPQRHPAGHRVKGRPCASSVHVASILQNVIVEDASMLRSSGSLSYPGWYVE